MNNILRKIIKEALVEDVNDKRQYRGMKWELNREQEYFLDYFITMNPDVLREKDYLYAQSVTGIPADSLKSIVLTHGSYNQREKTKTNLPDDFIENGKIPEDSRFLFGKKPYTAKDFNLDLEREPFERKPRTVSKEYADSIRYIKFRDLPQNRFKDEFVIDRNHKSPPVPDNMIQSSDKNFKIKKTNYNFEKYIADIIRDEFGDIFK